MVRTFCTNKIRKVTELSESLWEFSPCSGELKGKKYPVVVPCCWENLPDFSAYRGLGLFTKAFEAKGNVRLIFKGVSHTARVCVDGKEAGGHYNAYTPFSILLKDLEEGSHELSVYADNSFGENSALHVPNDYMSYGGISRGVLVEELEDAYIEYIHVIPVKTDEGWCAEVSVKVSNISLCEKSCVLDIELEDGGHITENLSLKAGEDVVIAAKIPVENAEVWEMENPRLYSITATLSDETGPFDDLIDRFGEYPTEVTNLLAISQVKIQADEALIEKIHRIKDQIEVVFSVKGTDRFSGEDVFKALSNTKLKATVGLSNDKLVVKLVIQPKMTAQNWMAELNQFVKALSDMAVKTTTK